MPCTLSTPRKETRDRNPSQALTSLLPLCKTNFHQTWAGNTLLWVLASSNSAGHWLRVAQLCTFASVVVALFAKSFCPPLSYQERSLLPDLSESNASYVMLKNIITLNNTKFWHWGIAEQGGYQTESGWMRRASIFQSVAGPLVVSLALLPCHRELP